MQESYTGLEKRKMPRRKTEIKVEYVSCDCLEEKKLVKVEEAICADMTDEGISIYLNEEKYLSIGTEVYLIINLKNECRIFITSEVVHITRMEEIHNCRFKVGFQFLHMQDKDRKALIELR